MEANVHQLDAMACAPCITAAGGAEGRRPHGAVRDV